MTIYKTFKENLFLSIKKCPNFVKKKKKRKSEAAKKEEWWHKRYATGMRMVKQQTHACLKEKADILLFKHTTSKFSNQQKKFRKGIKFLFLKHPPIV